MDVDDAVATTEPVSSDAGPRARSLVQWLLFGVPVGGYLAAGWAHRWIAEDGFIYLRVVHQVTAGHGPVFNIGERVETYTGTLWVALLALGDLVTPFRLEWIAVFMGLILGGGGLLLAMTGAKRLWSAEHDSTLFVPLGAVVFAVVFPVWVYTTSGLETGLAFGWLGACVWLLSGWARSPENRLSTPTAIVLGLGWLIRPELVILSIGFLVIALGFERSEDARRERVRILCATLALPVLYQIFRMGFFGSLVPNTAIAKEGSRTNWGRGWTYFRDFVDPYWLWVPIAALFVGAFLPLGFRSRQRSRARAVAAVFVVGGALVTTYIVGVGGDFAHARLLLPGFFAICAPVASIPATRKHLVAFLVLPWACFAIVTLRPAQYTSHNLLAHLIAMPPKNALGKVTLAEQGWGKDGPSLRWYTGPGYYYATTIGYRRVDTPLARGAKLPYGAFYGIGISGFALGDHFHILDLEGLADAFTSHLESTPSMLAIPRFPGHSKPLPAPWIAARITPGGSRPDPKDFPSIGNPLIPPTTGEQFQEQVAWARAALHCTGIQRVLVASDARMTPSRFVSNVLHSFGNTRTRIPPDPEKAYHQFCGSGTPPEVTALRSG